MWSIQVAIKRRKKKSVNGAVYVTLPKYTGWVFKKWSRGTYVKRMRGWINIAQFDMNLSRGSVRSVFFDNRNVKYIPCDFLKSK